MKIKIIDNALEKYVKDCSGPDGEYYGTDYWERIMENISGKIFEVDTSVLFKYEFNVKPMDNLFEDEIRIEIDYVEEVIDDIRKGKAYCELCNETSDSLEVCTNCGSSDYLEPLIDDEDEDEDDDYDYF